MQDCFFVHMYFGPNIDPFDDKKTMLAQKPVNNCLFILQILLQPTLQIVFAVCTVFQLTACENSCSLLYPLRHVNGTKHLNAILQTLVCSNSQMGLSCTYEAHFELNPLRDDGLNRTNPFILVTVRKTCMQWKKYKVNNFL